jgi:hypothetical protein
VNRSGFATKLLILTGLQPGVRDLVSCVTVSTVFQSRLLRTENLEDKARGKPLKRLAIFFSRPNTGLKPGENEMKTFEAKSDLFTSDYWLMTTIRL